MNNLTKLQELDLNIEWLSLEYFCEDNVTQDDMIHVLSAAIRHLICVKMDSSWPLFKILTKYQRYLGSEILNPEDSADLIETVDKVPIKILLNYLTKQLTDEQFFNALVGH